MSRNAWDFYVSLEHREVDEALSHWGRYWRFGGAPPSQANSLEGEYSGPQGKGHPTGWGDWLTNVPPRGWTHPDATVATRVEEIMMQWAIDIPGQRNNRLALKFWYVLRERPEWMRRRLKVPMHQVQPLLYDGRQEVHNRLTEKKTFSIIPSDSFSSDRIISCCARMGGRSVLAKNTEARH